jgi:hypothetical protein
MLKVMHKSDNKKFIMASCNRVSGSMSFLIFSLVLHFIICFAMIVHTEIIFIYSS